MPGRYCIAINCSNNAKNNPGLSFHRIPVNDEVR